MTERKRKTYIQQFKIDAVRLVTEQGYKTSEAARNLGIYLSVLKRWKEQLESGGSDAFPDKGHMALEKEELHGLRKQVKRLRWSGKSQKEPRPSLP